MFKKVLVSLSLLFVLFGVSACGKTIDKYVQDNMAEITKEYYFGENDTMFVTLSVGERESDYLLNGQATEAVDYSLLVIKFKEENILRAITFEVQSGDSVVDVEAEYNSFNNSYMVDIVEDITIGESFSIIYDGQTVTLEKQNFAINYENALQIACENLKDNLEEQKSYNHFNAECYLRVMSEKDNDFSDLYWCFTCLNYEGESFSVIISTTDGSILANSEDEENV